MLPDLELGQEVFIAQRNGKEIIKKITIKTEYIYGGRRVVSYGVGEVVAPESLNTSTERPIPVNEIRSHILINNK